MKMQKFSGKNTASALAQTGGIVGGMLLSNGASELVPLSNKTLSKAIVAGVGIATAVFVGGNDGLATTARAIGIGMAAQQGKEIIKDLAAPHLPNVKFIKDSFEQPTIAPATTEALNAARKRRKLGNPTTASMPFRMGVGTTPANVAGSSFVLG